MSAHSDRYRSRLVAVLAAAVVVVGGGVGYWAWTSAAQRPDEPVSRTLTTVPVTSDDLVQEVTARGMLQYADRQPLQAGSSGTITALPQPGTVLGPGAVLYRVDEQPVVLLRGAVPSWRTIEFGTSDGADVRQLEENLAAFGLFDGDVDGRFTPRTRDAVIGWQKSLGVAATGTLERASIMFSATDLRVGAVTVRLGAQVAAGSDVFEATSTQRVVNVELRLSAQQLAVAGVEVSIVLPDLSEITGTVASVGLPAEKPAADAGVSPTVIVPVVIALTDQAAAGAFERASVTVRFPSMAATGVLTVPVDALIATAPNSYGVEVVTGAGDAPTRTLPVTLGEFAAGRVAISGPGIEEGLDVVVAAG